MIEITQKQIWETLGAIDCRSVAKKKSGLTYLPWVAAWKIVKKHYPNSLFKPTLYDGKPFIFDENLGYMVEVTVWINGHQEVMQLPVMDGTNKAQRHISYTYKVKEWKNRQWTGKYIEKEVAAATMFDINTAIMRCMVKCLALFGLGHYIYEGEDVPKDYGVVEGEEEKNIALEKNVQAIPAEKLSNITEEMAKIEDMDSLMELWKKYSSDIANYPQIKSLFTAKKIKL